MDTAPATTDAQAPDVQIMPTGLAIQGELDFSEWARIGEEFGQAMKRACWCIGDWLLYGERFGEGGRARVPSEDYDAAVQATGLDRQTLKNYATVCRAFPPESRSAEISFAHHGALAPLPPSARAQWLGVVLSKVRSGEEFPSAKRLRLSIRRADTPRIVSTEELEAEADEPRGGQDNYIPHLSRLISCLRRDLPTMDSRQRAALRADAAPLIELLRGV